MVDVIGSGLERGIGERHLTLVLWQYLEEPTQIVLLGDNIR